MLELEVFIGELVSVNGLSSRSIVVGEISSLAHEILKTNSMGREYTRKRVNDSRADSDTLSGRTVSTYRNDTVE